MEVVDILISQKYHFSTGETTYGDYNYQVKDYYDGDSEDDISERIHWVPWAERSVYLTKDEAITECKRRLESKLAEAAKEVITTSEIYAECERLLKEINAKD